MPPSSWKTLCRWNIDLETQRLLPAKLLNVFGSRTGRIECVMEGEPLPDAPRGYLWRQVDGDAG
jgi:hypothetical protein